MKVLCGGESKDLAEGIESGPQGCLDNQARRIHTKSQTQIDPRLERIEGKV